MTILYLSLIATLVLASVGSALEETSTLNLWLWLLPFIAAMALMFFTHVTVYALSSYIMSGDYSDDDPIDPDERQRAVKERARSQAYWIILWSLFIGYGYWHLAFKWGVPMLWTPSASVIDSSLIVLLLWVMLYLPNSIIAWIESDPIPEIEEEENSENEFSLE